MNGFINVLKPAGMTSSDAVLAVRKLLPRKTPVGHGGTLDPDAAGVLPVCVGKATRLFDYIIDKRKTYIGELCLGIRTDTDDAGGQVISRSEVTATMQDVENALPAFTGVIRQVPPMYSALKRGGEPLYRLARRGEMLELEAREVNVHSITLLGSTGKDRYLLEINCGKGVYIRSLMRDIGDALGCGGHMSFLLRSRAGAFEVNEAHSLEELRAGDIESFISPMDTLLGAYKRVVLPGSLFKTVKNGNPIKPVFLEGMGLSAGETVRVYLEDDFAGMGTVNDEGGITFRAMLLEI